MAELVLRLVDQGRTLYSYLDKIAQIFKSVHLRYLNRKGSLESRCKKVFGSFGMGEICRAFRKRKFGRIKCSTLSAMVLRESYIRKEKMTLNRLVEISPGNSIAIEEFADSCKQKIKQKFNEGNESLGSLDPVLEGIITK